ncbi:hypothetical protein ACVJBD_007687 [Rhizobium mongolense]
MLSEQDAPELVSRIARQTVRIEKSAERRKTTFGGANESDPAIREIWLRAGGIRRSFAFKAGTYVDALSMGRVG